MSRKHLVASLLLALCIGSFAVADGPKRVLLLGQKRDHPPASHEYMAGLKVMAKSLEGVPGLKLSIHKADEPWKEGPELLNNADCIVMFLGQGSRWEQTDPKRQKALEEFAARGGAVVGLHWAIGGKDAKYIPLHLDLMGGCHGGPDRKYIVAETDLKVVDRKHPITTGVDDLRINEEFYYRLKFARRGTVTPLMAAVIDGRDETAAWAFERPDGGRSFGFCCMHYHSSWGVLSCRRMIAQAVLWTLKMPVPEEGLPVEIDEDDLEL